MNSENGISVSPPAHDGAIALQKYSSYVKCYFVSQWFGISLLVILLLWLIKYVGGLGFTSPSLAFNFHPLFMILGFVLFYGNSILIYRTLRSKNKPLLKRIHATLNGSILVLVALALWAVIYNKKSSGGTHLYTLHSWLGVLTCFLFVSQFVSGFATYLFPGASYRARTFLMPFHRFAGIGTFLLATATCLTGLNEKAIFSIPDYSQRSVSGILVNVLSVLLVGFVSLIVYLVTKPEFQRVPLPSE